MYTVSDYTILGFNIKKFTLPNAVVGDTSCKRIVFVYLYFLHYQHKEMLQDTEEMRGLNI